MGPEVRREKRYAQCLFVDMRALKRFMLDHVRLGFYNVTKAKSIGAGIAEATTRETLARL